MTISTCLQGTTTLISIILKSLKCIDIFQQSIPKKKYNFKGDIVETCLLQSEPMPSSVVILNHGLILFCRKLPTFFHF
jgi:hypothetical protein